MSDIIKQTIYDGNYTIFPLQKKDVEFKLHCKVFKMNSDECIFNTMLSFETGDKVEGPFAGCNVLYKLDICVSNEVVEPIINTYPCTNEDILVVSVQKGFYVELGLDVTEEKQDETIGDKTMAEIRHETAINQIMNGTEIGTWYQSFKSGKFTEEYHHTGLERVIELEDDDTPCIFELDDHHHYVIYCEIYDVNNTHNELRKYYREIFTGENMVNSCAVHPYHVQYDVKITPEGIDVYHGGFRIENESVKIMRPHETTAMIRLVDLGTYEYDDTDLLRWQAGYELGDKLYYDGDRTHIQNIRLTGGYSIMNGILMIDISEYHDLVITECSTDEYLCTVSNAIINPINPIIDERCFANCTIKDIKTDENGMRPGKYLIMNIDANEMNTHTIYDINIYGTPNKQEDEKSKEPSQITKDLDYLCELFEKNKKNLDPEAEKRAEKVIDISNTYADPNSSMTKKEALVKSLMAWLYGGPDNE